MRIVWMSVALRHRLPSRRRAGDRSPRSWRAPSRGSAGRGSRRRAGPAPPRGGTAPRTAGSVAWREALDGAVVQVDVRDLDRLAGRAQRVRVDREAVVLAQIATLPRREVLAGLVAAVVAELELVGLAAEREAEDLVAEADAEHRVRRRASSRTCSRIACDRRRDRRGRSRGRRRRARARAPRAAVVAAGTTVTSQPVLDEQAQDVALDAEVVGDDAAASGRAAARAAAGPRRRPSGPRSSRTARRR